MGSYTMHKLLIVLIIVLNSNQNVKGSFLDFIEEQFSGLKNTVSSTWENIYNRVRNKLVKSEWFDKETQRMVINVPIKMHRDRTFPAYKGSEHVQSQSVPTSSPTVQLAASHGRTLETHVLHTKDGYILTLHRISPSKSKVQQAAAGSRTVLLHHGLLGSSADWILLGPTKSLPYLLNDAGYDVWLANSRGNSYSRAHVSIKTDSKAFWNFSWQEIGEYDLPAIIHHIRETTNTTQAINYIGHSMGATALLVLLSMKPEYNKYFRFAVLLAPLAIMTRPYGPIAMLAPIMAENPPTGGTYFLGNGEYMPSNRIPSWMADKFCNGESMLCMNSLLFFSGRLLQEGSGDANFTARFLYHVPAGGSTKTILHYAQLIINKKFHKFGNKHAEFNLRRIISPIVIFSSSDDWLSNELDNQMLYVALKNPVDHIIINEKKISHTEFVWGFNADTLIFGKIIELINTGPNINKVK